MKGNEKLLKTLNDLLADELTLSASNSSLEMWSWGICSTKP
jgi:hypothetical protein